MKTTSAAGPGWTTSTAPDSLTHTYRRAAHGDQRQEHEEEHGEEASSEDAEGEAAGQEGQEVAAPGTKALRVDRARPQLPRRRVQPRLDLASHTERLDRDAANVEPV